MCTITVAGISERVGAPQIGETIADVVRLVGVNAHCVGTRLLVMGAVGTVYTGRLLTGCFSVDGA